MLIKSFSRNVRFFLISFSQLFFFFRALQGVSCIPAPGSAQEKSSEIAAGVGLASAAAGRVWRRAERGWGGQAEVLQGELGGC